MSKTGIRISNNVGTVMNEYPSDGLQVTIIKDGQETIAYVDGQLDVQGNVNPGSSVSTPATPQGASELGILTTIWNGKVDAAGNLLGKNGQIITEPENTDPLPTRFKDVAALLQWQVDHPYYHNPFLVDSTPVGQPGFGPPAGFGSTADGSLVSMQINPQPAPVTPLPPPASSNEDITVQVAWPTSGQVRPMTSGLGTGAVEFIIAVPAGITNPHPEHLGFMRSVERPGSAVLAKDMIVCINGAVVIDGTGAGDTAPGVNWTLGNPTGWQAAGAQFNVQPGDTIAVSIRNGPNTTTQPSDLLFDFATPLRY